MSHVGCRMFDRLGRLGRDHYYHYHYHYHYDVLYTIDYIQYVIPHARSLVAGR
jgi:hypothetical protein